MDSKERKIPELYRKKENCCGCTACFSICPTKAISMVEDEEGFLYPVADFQKCIKCYKCLKVCAFKKDQKKEGYFNG